MKPEPLELPYGLDTTEYRGYTIEVEYDPFPENPRNEECNLFTFVFYTHKLRGDDTSGHTVPDPHDYSGPEELKAAIAAEFDAKIVAPIYCYEHGLIALKTSAFSCPWDSGLAGFAVLTKEKCQSELLGPHGKKRFTPALQALAFRRLQGELENYESYVNGSVYGYRILDSDGSEADSCWGFYGPEHDESGLMESAQDAVECALYVERRHRLKQVRAWMRHGVSLQNRVFA